MSSLGLKQQWPWNTVYLRLYVILFSLFAIIAAIALYPSQGVYALFFLLAIPAGFLFRFIYARVASKVNVLMHCKSAQNGEVAESLLSIGHVQSPGVAILRNDVLILIPIVGRRRKVPLDNIHAVRKSSWLPGKYVWGKTALLLDTQGKTKLAFALPAAIAEDWYARITQK